MKMQQRYLPGERGIYPSKSNKSSADCLNDTIRSDALSKGPSSGIIESFGKYISGTFGAC